MCGSTPLTIRETETLMSKELYIQLEYIFPRAWGIHHRITSPTNVQSNGQGEHFVQTIKNSLTKAMEGGEDSHLAILSYVTTPLNHSLPSPTELLNSRKFRYLLLLWIKQQNHTQQYRNLM